MTVREIFDLRKQGHIEEAYEAIRARYAVYRGKYTTLCMFWTARDIFNMRMAAGRTEEARNLIEHRGSKKTGGYFVKYPLNPRNKQQ